MSTILAKSSGQSLEDHSILVSKFAEEIARQTILEINDETLFVIKISSLLHDIGKCTDFFQKKLNKGLSEDQIEEKLPTDKKFRHNEIGWAFLSRYLNGINKETLEKILNVIYWHHGISNEFGKYKDTDIDKNITEEEFKIMIGFANDIIKKNVSNDRIYFEEKDYIPKNTPMFYMVGDDCYQKNAENLLIRSCVISADRLASKYETATDEEIKDLISNYNTVEYGIDIKDHKFFGNERFTNQLSIVESTQKTTQINAPAGFGKTLLGMLFAITRNKRVIWVCPTNVIAQSVYKTINEESKLFGDNNISVELFYSSEVKKSTHNSKGFDSNIIVTNIDNYLTPSINNNVASRLYTIINSDVIFDEFHELIGKETALFSSFINIMTTRNRFTRANTLLLSATPTNMCALWDSIGARTLILPEKHRHFNAPHSVEFLFNTIEEEAIVEPNSSSLVVMNAIKTSQLNKNRFSCASLFHSDFVKSDREKNFAKLYEDYGKTSNRNLTKPNVMGTPIIQSSLDISFNKLYESVLSPETTLQRIGRCNRWGDYLSPEVYVMLFDNRSETKMREILYTNNLSNSWFAHLKQYSGENISIDRFYVIYNEFQAMYEKILVRELRETLAKSLDCLTKIYPVMYFSKSKTKTITAGGNKLRSNGNSVFVIAQYHDDPNNFTDTFSVTIRKTFSEEFDENSNTFKKVKQTWELLRNNNDSRFDYNEMINSKKYLSEEGVYVNARKIETPYIRFDKVYHPSFGLIKKSDLERLV
jgi:CRISPR-associated endonuclease/helicase Cas3